MKRILWLGMAVALAACGSNTEQRSATGAGSGAVAGALVGGPVGAVVGAAAGGAGGAGVSAAEKSEARDAKSRDTQMCVRLNDIDSTEAVDNRTLLLNMRGVNNFKRMDLVAACPGITFEGFRHSTSTGDLCTTDPLRVNQPAGATCMIKQIVDITPAEAEALRKNRR